MNGPSYFCDEPKASLQKFMGPFIKEQHEFAQCFFGTTIRFRGVGAEINNSVQREKQAGLIRVRKTTRNRHGVPKNKFFRTPCRFLVVYQQLKRAIILRRTSLFISPPGTRNRFVVRKKHFTQLVPFF